MRMVLLIVLPPTAALTMLVKEAAAKRVAAPRLRTNDMLNKVKGSGERSKGWMMKKIRAYLGRDDTATY